MLEPLAVRIYAARRTAAENRLRSSGMPLDLAEEWLAAYEAHAAQDGLDRDARDFWSGLEEWIAGQRQR